MIFQWIGKCKMDNAEQKNPHDTVACEQQLMHLKERYNYLQADFDNFRRNVTKEREQWTQSARASVLVDILPIVDNFERAFVDMQRSTLAEELKQYNIGFELIYKTLLKVLEKNGVEPMSNMTIFDPEFHEALMHVPAAEGVEAGTIVSVLQKGYCIKTQGKLQVLRPGQVSVAQ